MASTLKDSDLDKIGPLVTYSELKSAISVNDDTFNELKMNKMILEIELPNGQKLYPAFQANSWYPSHELSIIVKVIMKLINDPLVIAWWINHKDEELHTSPLDIMLNGSDEDKKNVRMWCVLDAIGMR